jgi:N-acetylmuramoyl-L-alanine amidase
MVKAVYDLVHKNEGVVFGVSPAGNYENCMDMGADVKTWLSVSGYIDYIAPQIYWTDNWGRLGRTKMFTSRLKQFIALNKIDLPMYPGLALYRTGYKQSDDKGWGKRSTNIRDQIKKLRSAGLDGFILFCSQDLFDKNSAKERYYLKKLLNPVKAASDTDTGAKIVVIDAGHQSKADTRTEPMGPGSSTPKPKVSGGTTGVSTHVPEYKINLEVAKKLQAALKKEGYTVYMVRTTHDVNISNSDRAKLAAKKKADLFIRIHCDAAGSKIRGFLTLTPANNKWTKSIYKKSLSAAKIIHSAVLKTTKANDRGVVKRGDLTGFNYSTVPSVLFEMGNMSNVSDDKLLSDKKYQTKLVNGMVNGVNKYFKKK